MFDGKRSILASLFLSPQRTEREALYILLVYLRCANKSCSHLSYPGEIQPDFHMLYLYLVPDVSTNYDLILNAGTTRRSYTSCRCDSGSVCSKTFLSSYRSRKVLRMKMSYDCNNYDAAQDELWCCLTILRPLILDLCPGALQPLKLLGMHLMSVTFRHFLYRCMSKLC